MDIFGFIEDFGTYEERKVDRTELDDGAVIDTARASDSTKPFETAVRSKYFNDGKWIIVELYDSKEEAAKGHKKWVETMKSNPRILTDVNTAACVQFGKAIGINLNKSYIYTQDIVELGKKKPKK